MQRCVWVRVPSGAPRRSKVRFAPTFFYSCGIKERHPPASLRLLSNCDPLCWARSWWAALRAAFFVSDTNIGFNRPLQIMIIRTRFQSGMASGFYLGEKQKRRYHECPSLFLYDPFLLSGSLALCPFHFSSFSLSRCQTVCHRASFSFLVFGGLNIHHSTTDEALFKFSTSPAERVAIPFAFAKVAKARQRQSLRLCRCFDVGDMLYPNRTCTQARRRAPTKPVP